MSGNTQVRPPAIAGSFYPADPQVLKQMLDGLLDHTPQKAPKPKALILPHAGYIYSGEIAAQGYQHLKQHADTIKRVVLLGPTHRVAVNGIATVSVSAFETPLGSIDIDQQAVASALQLPQVSVNDIAHAQEHSLEIHLPFLQTVLNDFKLVPFAVGRASPQEVSQLIEHLWGGSDTIIIISSDLSHFEPYDDARQHDLRTCKAIEELRYEDIQHQDACGATPMSGLLALAREYHYPIKLLDYRNSGDTAGDKSRVVGYASYILMDSTDSNVNNKDDKQASRLTWDEGQQLIRLAHASIEHGLKHGEPVLPTAADFPEALSHELASFVTLKQHGELRGCIGSLEARRPLIQDIAENAFAAAFRDPRFKPLTQEELDQTDISISILSQATPIQFTSESDLLSQIQPGVDGLILEDLHHRGTFLPSVWESIPDKKMFWQQLKRKAGLPIDHWSDTVKVFRYHTQTLP